MSLISVSIERFRNLEPVKLTFSNRLNLFVGANAAGKTSILEALYILGRARSFRTRSLDKAIQNCSDAFQIVARVAAEAGREVPVGISRRDKQLLARIDSNPVKRLSELAALFPLQWVGGNLHRIIEEGPSQRRQYLDWGLFHVKPDYNPVWKNYQKLLKQRNAALRVSRTVGEIRAWDGELANAGKALHGFRNDYLQELDTVVRDVMADLLGLEGTFEIRYRSGWAADQDFAASLEANLSSDREQGFTRTGPHRADLVLLYDNQAVSERLSRGQQKLLVIGLQVAQARLLKQVRGKSSLFLIDDLGAELDTDNQSRVMNLLGALDAQVFATAIALPDYSAWNLEDKKGFHVKHGVVSEMV